MTNKETYTKKVQKQMEKYQEKISKIDDLLKDSKASGKAALLSQQNTLKDKFKEGEKMLKKIESSTEEGFENIKESAVEIFDEVKDAFHEFSHFLSLNQLSHAKDEIVDYGNEKLDDVQALVKNHPLTVAACAVGIGFIIGAYLTRSK